MTSNERDELERLRQEDHTNSLGDRPHAMSASKIRRFIELEKLERDSRPYVSSENKKMP